MNRLLIVLWLIAGSVSYLRAQEPDSLRQDSVPTPPQAADSLKADTAIQTDTTATIDTLANETRRERRQRERREREAEEEEETIFKDSARLALEAMSARPWKQSLMVPGWGQITNGGLWWLKVPVIYGGLVSCALIFEFNHRYYHEYLGEAQYRVMNNDAPSPDPKYSHIPASPQMTELFIRSKDAHRRNRDLTLLVTVGWWGLQAVEAYVTSMLKHRWEIGDELGFSVFPTVLSQPTPIVAYGGQPYAVGLKVGVRF